MIHCTKILNDVFTPKFYCHKFLIIAEILELFAKLVYERIYKLAFQNDKSIDFHDITPGIVNTTAKDICSNWIFKCACIRELLPRIYIDIVFLRINRFYQSEMEIENSIITTAKKIAGISHPLISFYLGMFYAKVVIGLYPKNKSFIMILIDNLSKFQINDELIRKLNYDNLTVEEFQKILEPCFEWLIFTLSKNSNVVINY